MIKTPLNLEPGCSLPEGVGILPAIRRHGRELFTRIRYNPTIDGASSAIGASQNNYMMGGRG